MDKSRINILIALLVLIPILTISYWISNFIAYGFDETNAHSQDFVSASNKFAFSFFSNLKNRESGNIFFSPYGISNAFSMLYEGANGTTRDEIQSVFYFGQTNAQQRESVKATNSELNRPNSNYTLNIANALWVENNFPILKDYGGTLENYYSAKATNLDFKNNPEGSRGTINGWVADKTRDRILDLIPPGGITTDIKLIVTNAVYFKGNWSQQFDETLTKIDDFKITNQKVVSVPMMETHEDFSYYEDNSLQVLEMPYQGDLSMLVLLPKGDNVTFLENSLSPEKLVEWKAKLRIKDVIVYMPKFNFTTTYLLNDNLASMGVPSTFSKYGADFSGVSGKKDVYVNLAIHKTFLNVDEKGSEAAAATAIMMMPSIAAPGKTPEPLIFRADHPFVFFIYDNQNGLILFMGKVFDPSSQNSMSEEPSIPNWIKNNAKLWHENSVNDSTFVQGIQYLIEQNIIRVNQTTSTSQSVPQVPYWVKNVAGMWANNQISDDDFLNGIKYLVKVGIIKM